MVAHILKKTGEVGKSFAVVAEEVRRLANLSNLEAERIVPLVEEIRTEIDNALGQLNSLLENITEDNVDIAEK